MALPLAGVQIKAYNSLTHLRSTLTTFDRPGPCGPAWPCVDADTPHHAALGPSLTRLTGTGRCGSPRGPPARWRGERWDLPEGVAGGPRPSGMLRVRARQRGVGSHHIHTSYTDL